MSPSRRDALRASGVALSFAVAGCLAGNSADGPANDSPTTGVTTNTDTPESSTEKTTEAPIQTTTDTTPPPVREVAPETVRHESPQGRELRNAEPTDPEKAFVVGKLAADTTSIEPNHLSVWNDTESSLSVRLALASEEKTLLDRTFELVSGQQVHIELREPRNYELVVRVDGRTKTVTVPRSRFDCNVSTTDVVVRPDEFVAWTTSTLAGCGTTTGA